MPGYIKKALQCFRPQYLLPTHRAAATPGKYHDAIYPRIQLATLDTSPLLTPIQRTEIQAIVGTLLYYARAVDPSLLPIANEIASQQANPTQKVLTAANRALSYASKHQNNSITYYACEMILFLHVDASYLGLTLVLSSAAISFSATRTNRYKSTVLPTFSRLSSPASCRVQARPSTLLYLRAPNMQRVYALSFKT